MIPYFFYRSNLVKRIAFAQWKALQYFFTCLEFRAYLNMKFPMDFCNRSAQHSGFGSFINIKELTLIIFLRWRFYYSYCIDEELRHRKSQMPGYLVSTVLSFQLDLLWICLFICLFVSAYSTFLYHLCLPNMPPIVFTFCRQYSACLQKSL